MLKDFALIENGVVINIIRADELVAVQHFFPGFDVIEPTDETKMPIIGLRWNGSKFEQFQPHESWTWDENLFEYVPPTPKPEGDFIWSEEEMAWVVPIVFEVTEPTPE